MNLNNLGLTAGRERDHAAAEQYQRDSHAAFQDLNDRWGMAMTDVDRASALIELERFTEADALLRSALRDRWAARDDKAVAAALRGLARLALGEQRAGEARQLLGTAMALSKEVTDRLGQGQALELLTSVGAAQGDVDLGATALGALRAYRRATGVALPAWREERLQAAEQRLADAFGVGRVQELVEARLAHVPRTEDGDLQLDESGHWDSDAAPGSVIEPLLAG